VNTTRSDTLRVDFDISFPEISCNLLSMDVYDETGSPQTDAIHEVFKRQLSADGEPVGSAVKNKLGDTMLTEETLKTLVEQKTNTKLITTTKPECGGCYGSRPPGVCCNTCQDVIDGYQEKGWRFKPQGISQCESEAALETLKDQFASEGGCQIFGRLELNKASGHFHIAPHKVFHEGGVNAGIANLLDLLSFTFSQFNITHTVNSLSFGDQFPGITSPLDRQSRSLEDTHGMYQYYVKVVPTKYKSLSGTTIESNQYAVTEHMRHLAPGSGRGLPGVYFYYDVSPIQALYEEKRGGGLMRFLTSLCAIIGGAYTVMGLVDLLLTYILNIWNKKILQ
jgi:endoplasmic reticulum-Golgi intermediate compartment protein 3